MITKAPVIGSTVFVVLRDDNSVSLTATEVRGWITFSECPETGVRGEEYLLVGKGVRVHAACCFEDYYQAVEAYEQQKLTCGALHSSPAEKVPAPAPKRRRRRA